MLAKDGSGEVRASASGSGENAWTLGGMVVGGTGAPEGDFVRGGTGNVVSLDFVELLLGNGF